jgi:hypothetical protein
MFQTVASALDWLGIIAFTVTGALVATSHHFAAAQQFDHFRTEADISRVLRVHGLVRQSYAEWGGIKRG